MELSKSYSQAAAPRLALVQVPLPRPDLRPTADAAFLARDGQPDLPLAIPPSNSQIGEVSKTLLASTQKDSDPEEGSTDQLSDLGRTLKPYGIVMLPGPIDGAKSRASSTGLERP